ncbi:MAG: hypothetical protein EBS07_12365 [Sphingobacteriia bacterium]|nr:hypothetical protein [Sphingobacteriia bacterium]
MLGIPGEESITYAQQHLTTPNNFYVIGDVELSGASGNLNFVDKKVTVLGKNSYSQNSQPGGEVYGPKITLTTKDRLTGNLTPNQVNVQGTTATTSFFKGDACFGMWGGIVVDDSASSVLSIKINFSNTSISDAFVGIHVIPGSYDATIFDDVNIDACMYGVINSRDGIRHIGVLKINSNNQLLLKPFDYSSTGNSHNRLFDLPNNKLKANFFTQIGFWQSTDRLNRPLDCFSMSINDCMVGMRWGNGINLYSNHHTFELKLRNLSISNCHIAGLHILARNTLKIANSSFLIRGLFDGDYTTYQANSMLNQFLGDPIVENLNNVNQRFSYHYGIYSQYGHPLNITECEIIDKTTPKQLNYVNRPVGVYCKNMTSLTKNKFIFNDNYGSNPLEQGDVNTAEVRAIGVISDASNYFPSFIQSFITDNWFRNLKTAFVFRNTVLSGTNKLTVGCNYFQNVHTGFDFSNLSSFANDLGDQSSPCGNRFTWESSYFGAHNVAPNDCKVVIGNSTSPTYYGFDNEEILISLGNLFPDFNNGPGIKKGLSGASCPNAVRDPIPPKVKPINKPFEIDPKQFGIYNLLGRKVGELNSNEGSLPNGFYLKLDENGKTIFNK